MCTEITPSYAVIGHPIGHTMSPFIHQRLFSLSGVDHVSYEVMDIPPERLASAMPMLRQLQGFNITIPHKEAIIPLLDQCSPQATAFGSVNTVCTRNGVSTGYTTDGIGCLKALKAAGVSPEGHCLLLGSGGAARAVAFALTDACASPHITFAVRENSLPKALQLCASLSQYASGLGKTGIYEACTYSVLEGLASVPSGVPLFHLLLNCTSVGMYPRTDGCAVSEKIISRCSAVFDAVYNPHDTCLLKIAQSLGIPTVHGMAMLVWQAVAAHEIWDGSLYRPEDMEQLVEDAAKEMARRFLGGQK